MDGAGANLTQNSGTLTLSGANTYTGSTRVTGGTLVYDSGSSLANAGNINVTGGGILRVSGTITMASNTAFGVGSGISGTTGTVEVASGGVLSIGTGGSLAFIGGDYVNAGGTGRNNQYGTGVLTIDAGGTVNVAAAGTANSGLGGLDATRLWLGPYGNSGPSTINLNGGTLSVARDIGDGSGGHSVLNFDGGTLQAAFSDTSGQILAGGMSVNIRNGGATIDTQANDLTISLVALSHSTISGDNATDGGLTKLGSGTLTLSTTNTYNGGTTINGGTIRVAADNNLGDPAGGLTFGGGTLQIGGTNTNFVSARPVALAGDGAIDTGTAGNVVTFSGPINLGANTLTIQGSAATMLSGGVGPGAGGLTMNGSGALRLTGTNSLTGPTTINSGSLEVGGSLGGSLRMSDATAITPIPGQDLTVNASQTAGGALGLSGAVTYYLQSATIGGNPATGHILVNGDVSIGGTPTLVVTSLDGAKFDTSLPYHIIDYTGNLADNPSPWNVDLSVLNGAVASNWIGGTVGVWDTAGNWDGGSYSGGTVIYDTANKAVLLSGIVFSGTSPDAASDVIIAPAGGATVTGPASFTTVNSLVLGDGGTIPPL